MGLLNQAIWGWGLHDSLMRKWRRNLATEAHGDGLSVSERDDTTLLRKEVRTLRMKKGIRAQTERIETRAARNARQQEQHWALDPGKTAPLAAYLNLLLETYDSQRPANRG